MTFVAKACLTSPLENGESRLALPFSSCCGFNFSSLTFSSSLCIVEPLILAQSATSITSLLSVDLILNKVRDRVPGLPNNKNGHAMHCLDLSSSFFSYQYRQHAIFCRGLALFGFLWRANDIVNADRPFKTGLSRTRPQQIWANVS
jgi:hypothetical protein